MILRVTPTTLKDCTKGIRKIAELMQLITRAMERKVHEEGRKARLDQKTTDSNRPSSPMLTASSTSENGESQSVGQSSSGMDPKKRPSDSSLIVKVTVKLLKMKY